MQSVLVVEDIADVRRLFETALQQAGYRVYPTCSAAEAYEVDIVLTDLNMPSGAGMEMVSVVREQFPTTKS